MGGDEYNVLSFSSVPFFVLFRKSTPRFFGCLAGLYQSEVSGVFSILVSTEFQHLRARVFSQQF